MNALTGGDGHAAVYVRTAGLRAIKVDVKSIAVGTDHGGLAGFDENRFHGAVNNTSIQVSGVLDDASIKKITESIALAQANYSQRQTNGRVIPRGALDR